MPFDAGHVAGVADGVGVADVVLLLTTGGAKVYSEIRLAPPHSWSWLPEQVLEHCVASVLFEPDWRTLPQ